MRNVYINKTEHVKGHSINKLQNDIILSVFKIWKIRNIHFVEKFKLGQMRKFFMKMMSLLLPVCLLYLEQDDRMAMLLFIYYYTTIIIILIITFVNNNYAFSALMLLVGWQEGHQACKNWVVRQWRGYLSAARCKWFTYGPADATATPSSLAPVKSRMVYLSGAAYPSCPVKKGR